MVKLSEWFMMAELVEQWQLQPKVPSSTLRLDILRTLISNTDITILKCFISSKIRIGAQGMSKYIDINRFKIVFSSCNLIYRGFSIKKLYFGRLLLFRLLLKCNVNNGQMMMKIWLWFSMSKTNNQNLIM